MLTHHQKIPLQSFLTPLQDEGSFMEKHSSVWSFVFNNTATLILSKQRKMKKNIPIFIAQDDIKPKTSIETLPYKHTILSPSHKLHPLGR